MRAQEEEAERRVETYRAQFIIMNDPDGDLEIHLKQPLENVILIKTA